MKTTRQRVGQRGENLACQHLDKLGHVILDRNYRSGHLEIDIVSLFKDGLHFVEVKSRTAPVTADPELNVGFSKQKHLVSAAQCYIREKGREKMLSGLEIFFDVLTVVFEEDGPVIRYYPKAYTPVYY